MHDGLGLDSHLEVGQPFAHVISAPDENTDIQKRDAPARFMEALNTSGYAAGWEFSVPVQGQVTTLRFSGSATDDGMLIVGVVARLSTRHLTEELMLINNETVNSLRTAVKQSALSSQTQQDRDTKLLAELSDANNEAITAQRELAKKNAILARTNKTLEETQTALEARQVALEEANARLDALATIDGLTGVKNRRAFDERLAEEVSRSTRYGTPLSLLLLDVDKFKQYNDSFGHVAGDEVLKTVAHLLQQQARINDFVARYGGEEFALVLPNTDEEGAVVMAERLRNGLELVPWTENAVTASFGAATLSHTTDTMTVLIEAADRALYAAKESGRNRVIHVSTLPPVTL